VVDLYDGVDTGPVCIRRHRLREDFRENIFGKMKNAGEEGLVVIDKPLVGILYTSYSSLFFEERHDRLIDVLQLKIHLANYGAVVFDDHSDASLFLGLCDIVFSELV
jgi:hypothetical protein